MDRLDNINKLLIIAPSYYPNSGGVEGHIRCVSKAIANRGYKMTILVRYNRDIPRRQTVDGIDVRRLPKKDSIIPMALWCFVHLSTLRRVRAVHTHDYFPWALRRLFHKKPWVHTFHGYEGYPLRSDAIESRKRVRAEVPYCVGVGRFIEKWYGTKCDYYTYGAVDLKKFSSGIGNGRTWDYIFYGRLEGDTGFRAYVEAFRVLSSSNPTLSMVVVGDGSLRVWAEEYTQKYSLNIELVGTKPSVVDFLARSRVAFVSGYLGIIEAGALKKPIVAYYGTPIKKDYLLMHPMVKNMQVAGSPKELASMADEVYNRPAKHTEAMYNWAREQTWERIAEEYTSHY